MHCKYQSPSHVFIPSVIPFFWWSPCYTVSFTSSQKVSFTIIANCFHKSKAFSPINYCFILLFSIQITDMFRFFTITHLQAMDNTCSLYLLTSLIAIYFWHSITVLALLILTNKLKTTKKHACPFVPFHINMSASCTPHPLKQWSLVHSSLLYHNIFILDLNLPLAMCFHN